MTLETFFEKLDELADTPEGVKSMRELVMWSAFSGAFSAEERDQPMPEEWAVEGAPTLPAIPASWKWQRGSEVFDVIRGVSYKKNDASDSPVEGSFPVLRANNIGNGINFDGLVHVPRDNIRDEQFVRRGDILIAMSSGSKKLVGKAAPIVTDFKGAFGAFCGIIRNKSRIPDEVLARYFQSPQYTSWVTAAGRGIGINNLGRGDLDSLPVPTPPLAEQKRIVAKVDELMALCDRLALQQQERETRHAALARASLARFADAPTPANLNLIFHPSYSVAPADLRKSILTLAVQGKLVPQDPNDEPAEELLERVATTLPDKKSENPFLGEIEPSITDESEYELPPGWAWLPLGHVGIWATGCGFPMQYQGETDGEFLFCKVSDMNLPGNEVEIHTTVHKIDADVMKTIRARANPVGTVIFPKIGGAIATHKRRLVIQPTIIDNNCSGIQPIGLTDNSWLLLFLRNLDLTKYQSGTSVPAVSQGSLDPIRIGLPPLAEQRRIVAKAEQLMALVDELEAQLAGSRATAANLLSALVAELTGV